MTSDSTNAKYEKQMDESVDDMKPKFKVWNFPARYVLVVLLFFGTCVSFLFMNVMSLAIVAMVKKTDDDLTNCSLTENEWCNNKSSSDIDSSCPILRENGTSSVNIEGSYDWSSKIQGVVLGGFFYGYACTQIVMGTLADKFGAKWLMGTMMLLGSIFTLLVPIAADWSVVALIILRILTGMTQGVVFPCISSMFVRWIPETERSLMYCICGAGSNIGIILCMPLVSWLCNLSFAGGWPSAFYLFGGVGCIWSVLWMMLSSNSPISHPRISKEELAYIRKTIPEQGLDLENQPRFPWKSLLTSFPVWIYVLTFTLSCWIYYSRLTLLPTYLDQVLHFPIEENGSINALVNFVNLIFAVLSGYVADLLLRRKWLSKTNTRKLMECIALFGTSACLLGVIFSGCSHTIVITLLTISCGFQALANSADCVLAMDIAPAASGTIVGIANTFSSATGFLSPLITGFILDSSVGNLIMKWNIVFYMSVGVGLVGGLIALFLWTAEVQPWDPSYNEDTEEKKEKI